MNADAMVPEWLELLDPTADAGIRVKAPRLTDLFSRAAWGMFFLLTDVYAVRPLRRRPIRVAADDRPALLARWLSELNFLHQTEHVLFCRFDVRRVSSRALLAEVEGEPLRPDLPVHIEIKAVTYHGLRLERDGRLWKAEVIFDV